SPPQNQPPSGPINKVVSPNRRQITDSSYNDMVIETCLESSSPPSTEGVQETEEVSMVDKTPLENDPSLKPPDLDGPIFLGLDMDDIMAEGTATVVNWENRFAPLGEDVEMA
ncbi:hypothetical protein PIB30_093658, partial [Stylosanthes scabra]|nr:hypothetical protein [Stylosanthes scabra]